MFATSGFEGGGAGSNWAMNSSSFWRNLAELISSSNRNRSSDDMRNSCTTPAQATIQCSRLPTWSVRVFHRFRTGSGIRKLMGGSRMEPSIAAELSSRNGSHLEENV